MTWIKKRARKAFKNKSMMCREIKIGIENCCGFQIYMYIHFSPCEISWKLYPRKYTSCSNYLITVILLIWRHWLSGWFPAIFFDHLINSTKKLKRKKNNNRRQARWKMSTNFVLSVIEFQINIRNTVVSWGLPNRCV